ncbi:hypothetical protein AVEN_227436-1 [Araneus ventricosus]|uniref:Uncharacterized protein n=1 Tax=Araneus ventricosus TaxID=182803 RepID=A0A4Y2U0F1_ARAVE|nr:hypothetical protein AVEN_227436-1 [Araneus ventricosus]
MMLLQVACVLMLMTGSALSLSSKKSLDVPNYLQVILASYKVPKGVFQKESETQKMEASDAGQSIPSQMDSLLQLRRDLYHAYNLTYQIRDPIGRILYRNEHSDGAGSLRGSMNFVKDNGSKMTVINYSLQVEEHPTSSPELALEKMHKPSMRSSAEGNQMTEESSSQEERPRVISVSRAPQKLKSTSMYNNGKVFQKQRFLSPLSGMTDDSGFDDLETLSSQLVEDKEQSPDYLSDDMKGRVMVFHVKPKARGYEQVWKKGQGLVVDREYELPSSYDYRSAIRHRADLEDGENQQPPHVYNMKPVVKVYEASRDLDGKYQIPEKYNDNMKQQGFEDDDGEEPLYVTHSKPAVNVMQMSSDGDDSQAFGDGVQGQYSNDYDEFDSQDVAFPPVNNLQQSA